MPNKINRNISVNKLKKKLTRKAVPDPVTNNALRDIYDKLDALQNTTAASIESSEPDNVGDTAVVETTDGNLTLAMNTESGWMVDTNSNFQPIANKSFIPSLGSSGRNNKPIYNESVKYNKNISIPIKGPDSTLIELSVEKQNLSIKTNTLKLETEGLQLGKTGDKVLIKNDAGILKVRNAADNADADIQCANVRDVNGNKAIEIKAESEAVNRFTISSSASGANTHFSLDGEDDNIGMELLSKGTGDFRFGVGADGGIIELLEASTIRFQFDPSNSFRREFTMFGSAYYTGLLDTNNAGELRLWNKDISSAGTAAHIKISASDDLYLGAGGGDIKLSSGGTGQNGATFDLGTEFATFKAAGGSQLIHTATSSSEGFTIDSNQSGDDGQLSIGLKVDYDRTVASSGTNTMLDVGIDVDVNSASLGTGLFYGMSIDVVGNTSGTSTSTGIYINSDGSDTNIGAHIITSGTHLKLAAEADPTNDYGTIAVADTGDMTIATTGDGTRDSDITLDADGKILLESAAGGVYVAEAGNASADTSAYGQLWVKSDTPNNLYFTDDTGQDIPLTNNGKARTWTNTSGGYKTNNNSATVYYFQYYPNYHSWGNGDSSPTGLTFTDSYSYQWCATSPGVLTNISVTLRAFDTGVTDPVKFYVYKGVPANGASSTVLTLIGTTGTITPVASRQMALSTDISSSNDFAAGDKLWVMYKKDSTSGNQDLYFAVTISGEYT